MSDLLDLLHFVTPYQIQVVFLKRVLDEMRVQVKELLISATDEEVGRVVSGNQSSAEILGLH